MDAPASFRSLAALCRVVSALLVVCLLACVATAISSLHAYWQLGSGNLDQTEADAIDQREFLLALVHLAAVVVTALPFAAWILRAHRNLPALGVAYVKFTPGWALAWYFVPIFGFWMPCQAMSELWRASAEPRAKQRGPVGYVVGLWWCCWIAALLSDRLASTMARHAQTLDEICNALLAGTCSSAASVALCGAAYVLVRRITAMQETARHAAPPGQDAFGNFPEGRCA